MILAISMVFLPLGTASARRNKNTNIGHRNNNHGSVEDDCEFCFVEQWVTQEHLNAYMRSDLYSAIQGAFKVLTEHFEIELTTAEDTIQLYTS